MEKGRVPSRYYKYLKDEHLKSFMDVGTLRVGTLYEYRDVESHGDQIGDQKEGTARVSERFKQARGDQLSDFARTFINISGDAAETNIDRVEYFGKQRQETPRARSNENA